MRDRWAEAKRHLHAALAVNENTPLAYDRLGIIAMVENRPADAVSAYRQELRQRGKHDLGLESRLAQAYRAVGDAAAARKWYRRAIRRNPDDAAVRDSLAALEREGR
jgi:tetratricopeptide (TPR) repeat protein